MNKKILTIALAVLTLTGGKAYAQTENYPHDNFYWLTQINKASLLMNPTVGLLDKDSAAVYGRALEKVIQEHAAPDAYRPANVVEVETMIVEHSSPYATAIHVGRSSQDMFATARMAIVRENMLVLAENLNELIATMLQMSEQYKEVVVPEFTNGVVAQPNSLGHVILAYCNAFMRDLDRVREYYNRLDMCPMGTGVLNGSSWPLDRKMMATYLGFSKVADNAFDANQIRSSEILPEAGFVCSSIALHAGEIMADLVRQYSQPLPWFLLKEGNGNTYASSAMPQKRNPGIINSTRVMASEILGAAQTTVYRQHNLPVGMADGRGDKSQIVPTTAQCVKMVNRVLNALDIFPDRALEALKGDWSTSEELADCLMREYHVPFRTGHHYCSEIVGFAKQHNYNPSNFPFKEAKRIYKEVVAVVKGLPAELPYSEKEWREKLDPVHMVQSRVISGGPQLPEMNRMLTEAKALHQTYIDWTCARKQALADADRKLQDDFQALIK